MAWRNRVIGSPRFQRWAARNLLTRPIARRRSAALFDLVAGFSYSQILLACVESGLIDFLWDSSRSSAEVASHCQLSDDATLRLLRGATALDLVEEVAPDLWMLGEQGAALHANVGAQAMIRHHRLLYADLADPLALLRDDRATPTALSEFWTYAAPTNDHAENADNTRLYSELMASSQALVAGEVLSSYRFDRHQALLDVGGGMGAFVGHVAERHPSVRLGIFDLPEVITHSRARIASKGLSVRVQLHPGSFFEDPIPNGYDCVTLVRILHDHDDTPALKLLRAIRESLSPGDSLVIAEPMAGASGAKAMGDAYFGLYLWAMRSGRPRTPQEIGAMCDSAGFARWRPVRTNLPVITSLIVVTA